MTKKYDYRDRIYRGYVTARDKPLAPPTLEGLRPRLPYFKQLIRRHFPRDFNAAILDFGCGHGALLYALQCEGYRNARGVDGSPEQVEAAQKLGIKGVEQGDVVEVLATTADGSLDVVITFDLIEHFTKTELIELIDEVRRVLKPDSRWIIHVPNAEGLFGSKIRHDDFTHEQAFTRVSIAQLLKSSGFSDVACFEDRPVSHGVVSTIRAMLWQFIRLSLLFYIAVETGEISRDAILSQNLLAVARRGD